MALEALVQKILLLDLPHPVRVGVDGRTASGKTTLADALADALRPSGRPVIRASIDDFHNPADTRHRQGRFSPDGYYEDARDLAAVRTLLLDPLGPAGTRHIALASFDLDRDRPIDTGLSRAGDSTILVMDGTLLQRPELADAWDLMIFLDVPAHVARERGVARDAALLGGLDVAAELYRRRYEPAFKRYEKECNPLEAADVVISPVTI